MINSYVTLTTSVGDAFSTDQNLGKTKVCSKHHRVSPSLEADEITTWVLANNKYKSSATYVANQTNGVNRIEEEDNECDQLHKSCARSKSYEDETAHIQHNAKSIHSVTLDTLLISPESDSRTQLFTKLGSLHNTSIDHSSSSPVDLTEHTAPTGVIHKIFGKRVTINVSGMRFETRFTVLDRHPYTLLGNSQKRRKYFHKSKCEFFFDRHRPTFEAIFHYYQYGGKIKRPTSVPDEIFIKELEFYEIEKSVIDAYKRDEGYIIEEIILPENKVKRYLWMLFEYPETSTAAFIIAIMSVVFTVISTGVFCIETLPPFNETHCKEENDAPNFTDPFFVIETVCTVWFTLEFILRFLGCPCKKTFIKDLKNIIDVAVIVPYYVTLLNILITYTCEGAKGNPSLAFLRVIRLIRIFKLAKHSAGLQVLVLSFRASLEGLTLFLVALIVCILVFSSTIYYVELTVKNSQMESIPDAFWWAIITMCTVGYGDKVPVGALGKLIGGACALTGVLTLAIPVPIITENFNKFYTHKTGRRK